MDIGKAFTYVFEDPKWITKVLIGGLLSLVPIVNFAVFGYVLTALKNVADGQAQPLPEWGGDFGKFFMKGLYAFVGLLVYFLPAIILSCCIGIFGGVLTGSAGQVSSDAGNAVSSIFGIVSLCLNCLISLYSLVAGLTFMAPLTRFAMSDNQLSLFWDFRGIMDFIQKNLQTYIVALLVGWVASFVASFGLILCLIGVIFTSFWAWLVQAYLFGQVWRNSQGLVAAAPA